MPRSAPGSRPRPEAPGLGPRGARGFTLIELMIVVAVVVVAAGAIALSLRDGDETRLEEEAARLAALLEMGRAEARVAGTMVTWAPVAFDAAGRGESGRPRPNFRFNGLLPAAGLPERWLAEGTSAEVVGAAALVLGPEAILPPQRVVLRLGAHRREVASDGLAPFAAQAPAEPAR